MTSPNLTALGGVTTPTRPALIATFTLYVFPVVVGVAGNALIVQVIVTHKSLRTGANAYIANMAALDLLACALLVPLRVVFYLAQSSMRGHGQYALCRAEVFFHSLVDAGKMFFLAAISFERYQAVANPFQRDKAAMNRRAILTLTFLWLLMLLYAALLTVFFHDTIMYEFCLTSSGSPSFRQWGDIDIYFVLPLSLLTVAVVVVSYALMFRILHTQSAKMMSHSRPAQTSKVAPAPSSVVPVKDHSGTMAPSMGVSMTNVASAGTTHVAKLDAKTSGPGLSTHLSDKAQHDPTLQHSADSKGTGLSDGHLKLPVSSYGSRGHGGLQGDSTMQAKESNHGSRTARDSPLLTAETQQTLFTSVSGSGSGKDSPLLRHPSVGNHAEENKSLVAKKEETHHLQSGPSPGIPATNTKDTGCGTDMSAQSDTRMERQRTNTWPSPDQQLRLSARTGAVGSDLTRPSSGLAEFEKHSAAAVEDSLFEPTVRATSDTASTSDHLRAAFSSRDGGVISPGESSARRSDRDSAIGSCSDLAGRANNEDSLEVIDMDGVGQNDVKNQPPLPPSHADNVCDTVQQRTNIQTSKTLDRTISTTEEGLNRGTAQATTGKDEAPSESAVKASSMTPGSETLKSGPTESSPDSTKNTTAGATPETDQKTASTAQPQNNIVTVRVVEMDGTAHVEKVGAALNVQGDVCILNPRNRVQGRRRMEVRVAKRLVVIFLTFLLLWLPYPLAVLTLRYLYIRSLQHLDVPQVVTDVLAVLSAVSTLTAAVNPVLYGLANVNIRSVILTRLKTVCRCCLHRQRRP